MHLRRSRCRRETFSSLRRMSLRTGGTISLPALFGGLAVFALAHMGGKGFAVFLTVHLKLGRLGCLPAVLAAVGFAVLLPRLWNAGGAGQTTLALLTTAWASHAYPMVAVSASMAAL